MSGDVMTVQQQGIFAKLNYLFLIVVLGGTATGIVFFMGGMFVENLARLSNDHIYVMVSRWDVPVFLIQPCFVVLVFALVLRLFNQATDRRIQWCVNFCVVFAGVFIIVRLLYGFSADAYMNYNGYSSCWQYSSPQVMSPTVWVKNPDFCIANSGSVRTEILSWMDTLPNAGKDVSVEEVETKVAELLEQWEKNGIN